MIDLFRMPQLSKWFRSVQLKFVQNKAQLEQHRTYIEKRLANLNQIILKLLDQSKACLSEKSLLRKQLFLMMRLLEVDHLSSIELRLQSEGKFALCTEKLTHPAQDTVQAILNLLRKKMELDACLETVYMQLERVHSELIDAYFPACSDLPVGTLRQQLECQLSDLLKGLDGKENQLFDAYVYTVAHSNEEIKWIQLILFGVPLPTGCFQNDRSTLVYADFAGSKGSPAQEEITMPYPTISSVLKPCPAGFKLSDTRRLSLIIQSRFNRLRTYFMEELALETELQNQTYWLHSRLDHALMQLCSSSLM